MKDIIIVDLETTGLSPEKHEIIEIGAVNVTTGETFECKVHPLHISTADSKALEINGYKHEDWADAFLLPNALKLLNQFIGAGKPYFMAYNASFDWSFLQSAYAHTGISDPFHYHHLDLMTLAWFMLPKQTSLSLKNVCLTLEIDSENVIHRALAGALKAKTVFDKLNTL